MEEQRQRNPGKARRANDIFEREVRPHVDVESDSQKYVAIDVESEDFEVDRNQRAAVDRLAERRPEAEGQTLWLRRVGSRYAHHFGGRLQEDVSGDDSSEETEKG